MLVGSARAKEENMMTDTSEMDRIKDSARKYFDLGLNVVPVKGKIPLLEWKLLQTNRQTPKEFEDLPWSKADGFALIGGSQRSDGLYICAIDLDVKNVPTEAFEKGQTIVKELPRTQTERTPSGGLHLIYLSTEKPRTISAFHQSAALELLGENKLIVMAPSRGYENVNSTSDRSES